MRVILFGLVFLFATFALQNCAKVEDPSGAIPTMTISDGRASEGEVIHFILKVNPGSFDTISFYYQIVDIDTSPDDYVGSAEKKKFTMLLHGGNTATISVLANTDTAVEATETFKIILTDPTNVTLLNTEAIGTILDAPPEDPNAQYMRADVTSIPWQAITTGPYAAGVSDNRLIAYGTDKDSQMNITFYQAPTGVKTYQTTGVNPTSDDFILVTYSPNFFTSSGTGVVYYSLTQGQLVITKFSSDNMIEGTFRFTCKASNANVVIITDGRFRLPVH